MVDKLSIDEVNKRLFNKNIELIGDYINVDTLSTVRCLVATCNHIWKPPLKSIFFGCGCPKCANNSKLTNDIIDERLKERTIKRIENFVNTRTKIKFECLIDGHIWKNTPANILCNNQGCPICKLSKSEIKIMNLIKQNIKYEYFENHKPFVIYNKKIIPDFYLEIGGNKIIIEYNGEQHYKPVRFNSISKEKANNKFKNQQIRDEIIRKYCKENNIYLLEIPYYWKNEKIINQLTLLNDINYTLSKI